MNREESHRPDTAPEEDSRLLHMLMDHLPHSIFFKDDQNRFIRINKACAEKFGLNDPSEAVGKTDFDFFDREHAEAAFEDDSKVMKTGIAIINKVEKETFPDGEQKVKWTATTKVPYRDENGTNIGTFGITRDITESRESEKKYRDIFENIQDVIYRTDKEGIIMDISPSIERYSGYSCKELIGSQVSEFYYYQDDRQRLVEVMRQNGKVDDFEIRLKTADGKLVYTSVNSHLLRNDQGEVVGVEGIMRDITDRKLTEISLQDTYNFYEQILETVSEGIFVCDHNLNYTYWNREMEKISGLSESEVIGKSPSDIFPHVEHNQLLKNYQLALGGESVASEDYFYHVPETNHYGWAQAQYVPMRNNSGQIEGVLVTLVEISERKEVEERLRESDETLRKLSEQVPGTIYQFQMLPDRTFRFPYASQGFREIYGIEPADVAEDASALWEIIHPDDLEQTQQSVLDSFRSLSDWKEDYRIKTVDGSLKWVQGQARPERQEDGSVIWHGYVFDITEKKTKQNELRKTLDIISDQNQRLQNFAHIVSHNLRNHAGNISMLLSLYSEMDTQKERDDLLNHLNTASNALNESIQDLNKIVDSQAEKGDELREVEFNKYLEKVKTILSTQIKLHGVTINEEIPKDFKLVYNPAYLESILLNLVSNAIKYRHPDRKSVVTIRLEEAEGSINLTIADNGLGIDLEKHGHQLFGMYNTFHQNEDSKGVGLYITRNQIETMGGSIDVESEPGSGTTFYVRLTQSPGKGLT